MGKWRMVPVAVLLIVAAACPGVTQEAGGMPAKPAPERVPVDIPVEVNRLPRRPLDMVRRLLNLTEQQQTKILGLQREWLSERRAAAKKLDGQLDDKYLPLVQEVLNPEQKDKLTRIIRTFDAHRETVETAEGEFRQVWEKTTGEKPETLPATRVAMVRMLPGADTQERKKAYQALLVGYYRELASETSRGVKTTGLKRPDPLAGREAWREFRKEQAITHARLGPVTRRKADASFGKQARASLTDDLAKMYDVLAAALDAYAAKRHAADEVLVAQLRDLVEPDRLLSPHLRGLLAEPAAADTPKK